MVRAHSLRLIATRVHSGQRFFFVPRPLAANWSGLVRFGFCNAPRVLSSFFFSLLSSGWFAASLCIRFNFIDLVHFYVLYSFVLAIG